MSQPGDIRIYRRLITRGIRAVTISRPPPLTTAKDLFPTTAAASSPEPSVGVRQSLGFTLSLSPDAHPSPDASLSSAAASTHSSSRSSTSFVQAPHPQTPDYNNPSSGRIFIIIADSGFLSKDLTRMGSSEKRSLMRRKIFIGTSSRGKGPLTDIKTLYLILKGLAVSSSMFLRMCGRGG